MARRYAAGLVLVALLAGCGERDNRWDKANQDTKGQKAVAAEAVEGSALNKFFPKDQAKAPWDMVYKVEKKGMAETSLKHDGKEVATLAIADTVSFPDAAKKFEGVTEKFLNQPIAKQGDKGTAILVANRFQVTVRSKDDSFTEEKRKEWLEKFDLIGLGQLK